MYLLDSDLSSGWHYLPFEQPGTDHPANTLIAILRLKRFLAINGENNYY